MADKAIGSLVEATVINDADRFVLEQSGQAKQISGATMISELAEALDGHGGIQSIDLVGSEGNVKTYRITFTDGTTYDYEVRDGESGNYAVVAGNLAPYSDASGAMQSIPFLSQGTGRGNGSATVSAGNYCQLKKKLGNTVCVNSMFNPANAHPWTQDGITVSFNSTTKKFTISGTATATIDKNIYGSGVDTVKGRKYAFISGFSGGSGSLGSGYELYVYGGNFGTYVGMNKIAESTNGGGFAIYLKCQSGVTIPTQTFSIDIPDISLWFGGNANIPSDLLAHPENWGRYYAGSLDYEPGTLKSADGTVLKSIGRNLWDEEWEVGGLNTADGSNDDSMTTRIRSMNYFPVIPNAPCYKHAPNNVRVVFYDNGKNFVSSGGWSLGVFNVPSNAYFIRFMVDPAYGTTYKHDITFSLYHSGESGYDTYYPYSVLAEVDTGSEVLRSAGAVADEKTPDGTITRRVGVVDLGTLNWTFIGDADWNCFYVGVTGRKPGKVMKSSKYALNTVYGSANDKALDGNANNTNVYIRDTSFNGDAAAFKSAMSGAYLYYELATPTTEQGTAFAENIPCDPVGSMSWENTKGIPQGAEIFYPFDYAGTLDSMIDALPSANGTYTLKATVANGKITYSWVAS